MKFLIDNNLSPLLSNNLNQFGFESVHVKTIMFYFYALKDIFTQRKKNLWKR